MGTWNTRGLRGSTLEEMINRSNEKYRENGLALIQKVPTPITPMEIDKEGSRITLAYFDQKSTVDYIGVVQGVPVCFDAKECADSTFALRNIHPHQIEFMRDFEKQDGVELYYLKFEKMWEFWQRAENGGRKSFRHDELDPEYVITPHRSILVPYLDMLNRDLQERND